MLKSSYKELKKNQISFSASDELGSFDYLKYIISLNSLCLNDLKVLSNEKNINKLEVNLNYSRVLSLAVHEYTHFIDATSTVWGINHLNMMNRAYLSSDAIIKNEKNFFKAKEFHNHVRKIKYPKYYNIVGSIENPKNWKAITTIGKLFNSAGKISDESIIFMRFETICGEEIARSPISAISILEASAMANELLVKVDLVNKIEDEGEKKFANYELNKEVMSIIYNKELTEYSACVHMVAQNQKCSDVIQAFFIVSIITKLVLNSTKDVYDKIISVNTFKDFFGCDENSVEYERLKQGLVSRNMGVLYYLLVLGLPMNSYKTPRSANSGVLKSLLKIGIDIDFIKQYSKEEFYNKCDDILTTEIIPLKNLVIAAKENFEIIDIEKMLYPFKKLNLPKVVLDDFDKDDNIAESLIFKNKHNSLSEFSIDECYDELSKGEKWVNRFNECCI